MAVSTSETINKAVFGAVGIAVALCIGLLLWGGQNLVDIKTSLAASNQKAISTDGQIATIQSTLNNIQQTIALTASNNLTKADADSRQLTLTAAMAEQQRQITDLLTWRARVDEILKREGKQ